MFSKKPNSPEERSKTQALQTELVSKSKELETVSSKYEKLSNISSTDKR